MCLGILPACISVYHYELAMTMEARRGHQLPGSGISSHLPVLWESKDALTCPNISPATVLIIKM